MSHFNSNLTNFVIRSFPITLRSLINRGIGIVGGLEKISRINSRGAWYSRGGWKKLKNLMARAGEGGGGGGGWNINKNQQPAKYKN